MLNNIMILLAGAILGALLAFVAYCIILAGRDSFIDEMDLPDSRRL